MIPTKHHTLSFWRSSLVARYCRCSFQSREPTFKIVATTPTTTLRSRRVWNWNSFQVWVGSHIYFSASLSQSHSERVVYPE